MATNLTDLTTGIRTTLLTAASVSVAQKEDQLKPSTPDLPVLRIWPVSWDSDPTGNTDRTTFGAGVRYKECEIRVEVLCHHLNDYAEAYAKLVEVMDDIIDVIEAQDTKPYFGVTGLQAFRWSWRSVVYQNDNDRIIGAELTLMCSLF